MFLRIVGKDYGIFASQCEHTMTVAELIQALSQYEADLPIYLYDDDPEASHYHSITKQSIEESYLLQRNKMIEGGIKK